MAVKKWNEMSHVVLLLMLWNCFQGVQLNKGRSFLVIFPQNDRAIPRILLTATNLNAVEVTVTTHLEHSSHVIGGWYPMSKSVQFSSDLIIADSYKSDNSCVRIDAEADIVVHAFTTSSVSRSSSAAFLVLPLQQLSIYYVTLMYCPTEFCLIAVASPYNNTKVNVTLKAETNHKDVVFGGKTFLVGDVIQETLQENESMQILVKQLDLTGSIIESDKPVVVISGGTFVRLGGSRRDSMQEMMPSVEGLGLEFVIPAFPGDLNGTWVFVAFTQPNTILDYDPRVMVISEQNSNRCIFHLPAYTVATLTASHPVVVGLSPPSGRKVVYFDPSLVLIMPTSIWTSQYTLPFIMINMTERKYLSSLLVLFTREECNGPIFMNDFKISDLMTWTITSPFKAGYMQLSGIRTAFILHSSKCTFGGYLAERAKNIAISVPLGWNFQETQPETVNASKTAGMSFETILTSKSNTLPTTPFLSDLVLNSETDFLTSVLGSSTPFFSITAVSSVSDSWPGISEAISISSAPFTSFSTVAFGMDTSYTAETSLPITLQIRPTLTVTTISDDVGKSYLDLASNISIPRLEKTTTLSLSPDEVSENEFVHTDSNFSLIISKPPSSSFINISPTILTTEPRFHDSDLDLFTVTASTVSTFSIPHSIIETSQGSHELPLAKSKLDEDVFLSSTEVSDFHSKNGSGINSESQASVAKNTFHIDHSLRPSLTPSNNAYSSVHKIPPTPDTFFDHTTEEPLILLSVSRPSFLSRWTETGQSDTFQTMRTSYDQLLFISDYTSVRSDSDIPLPSFTPSTSLVANTAATMLPYNIKSTPNPKPGESRPTELKLCPCKCSDRSMNVSTPQSKEETSQILTAIVKGLSVNRSQLSSSVRKKTSILIMEPTSTVIGSAMAVSVMAVVSGFIVIPDIMAISSFLYKTSKRLL